MDRDHWIRIRQALLKQVKEQVRAQVGGNDAELESYLKAYENEFTDTWWPEDKTGFLADVFKANIVIAGDFHPFSQSQRTHLRILRKLPAGSDCVLALECFESKDQEIIDQFMKGEINETSFLESVHWEERWGFPWKNYLPLIELARKNKFKVVGVNEYHSHRELQSLKARDEHVAVQLKHIYQEYPDHLIYTFIGNLHLAQSHLIEEIKKMMPQVSCVRVFQNSEKLYFQLAEKGLENQVDILKGNEGKYCLFTSPPWVKWQSYLLYLEQAFDSEIEFEDEDDEIWESLDYTDHVQQLVQFISKDLSLELPSPQFEVFSPGDAEVWETLSAEVEDEETLQLLIKNSRSFYLPKSGDMYLSRSTINHASAVAGHYIQAMLSGRTRVLWNMPEDYCRLIWCEAVAYFLSKLVNHKRKTETIRDLNVQLASTHPEDKGKEALMLSMDQKFSEIMSAEGEAPRARKFIPKEKYSYIESARILGPMLGEKLYLAYRGSRLSRNELMNMISFSVEDQAFPEFYEEQVKKLEKVQVPAIFKEFKLS